MKIHLLKIMGTVLTKPLCELAPVSPKDENPSKFFFFHDPLKKKKGGRMLCPNI